MKNKNWMSSYPNDQITAIPCGICGGQCIEFSIPSDIWNEVIRRGKRQYESEYLCMDCFLDALRRQLGLPVTLSEAEERFDFSQVKLIQWLEWTGDYVFIGGSVNGINMIFRHDPETEYLYETVEELVKSWDSAPGEHATIEYTRPESETL